MFNARTARRLQRWSHSLRLGSRSFAAARPTPKSRSTRLPVTRNANCPARQPNRSHWHTRRHQPTVHRGRGLNDACGRPRLAPASPVTSEPRHAREPVSEPTGVSAARPRFIGSHRGRAAVLRGLEPSETPLSRPPGTLSPTAFFPVADSGWGRGQGEGIATRFMESSRPAGDRRQRSVESNGFMTWFTKDPGQARPATRVRARAQGNVLLPRTLDRPGRRFGPQHAIVPDGVTAARRPRDECAKTRECHRADTGPTSISGSLPP